jgi:carboxylesterase
MMFSRASSARFEQEQARRFVIAPNGVVVGAETIVLPSSHGRAVLVLHGFNDTPQSMAYLADALHRDGWSVVVPRLPGHGVSLARMARESRAPAWRDEVVRVYAELRAQHETVVVCGQSMGGALALLLAESHPEIPALVLLAPYIGMPAGIQWQIALAWLLHPFSLYRRGRGGDRSIHDPEAKAKALSPGVITAPTMSALRSVALAARQVLPRIGVPTLYLQSREDNRISVAAAAHAFAALGGTKNAQRWLSGCGHIISADYCRAEVARQVTEWFALQVNVSSVNTPDGPASPSSSSARDAG